MVTTSSMDRPIDQAETEKLVPEGEVFSRNRGLLTFGHVSSGIGRVLLNLGLLYQDERGRDRFEKNWPAFFEAVACATNGAADTRVLAVGSGTLLSRMKELCRNLGLEGQTLFTGYRDDVPRLLLAADVMACTSVRESGPIVVQEAMACGVPVVTYDVGETRAMVRENLDGQVVDNGDVEGLAAQLKHVLSDPAKRAAYSESCRERAVAEFDVRVMVRRMELVLSNARIRHVRPHVLGR